MKKFIILLFTFACSFLSAQTAFKYTATAANIVNNWTVIDNPATNSNPNVLLQVTSDYGASGPYHDKSVGVWYTNGKWTIFNQDRTPMTVNAKFNVMVINASDNAFIHTSTTGTGHITVINNPKLNNNPNARFLVTQNWGGNGPYNSNPIGVYYTGSNWAIYNQNRAVMPLNAKFNIVINDAIFVVDVNAPQGNYFFFDNPSTTNQPNALLFATQYWTGVYNTNEVGVWYSGNKWSVYNQSRNALPQGSKFMVWSYLAFTPIFTPILILPNRCVTVFEQPNYQGRSQNICNSGDISLSFSIGSIRVPNGFAADITYTCPPTAEFSSNIIIVGDRPSFSQNLFGVCNIKIVPITQTLIINIPDFTEKCPTRHYRGSQEFGSNPDLYCSTSIVKAGDQRSISNNVFYSAISRISNGPAVDGSWSRVVYNAPTGSRIITFDKDNSSSRTFTSRTAGAEFGFCNEGQVHTSGRDFQLQGNGLVREMVLVGDTGGKDINDNCGCDTKIKRISFNSVIVYLTNL